ncbi:MAG: hypothetical protein M3125_09070, partial [Gemmatimonadota bacterium]|nr:hypothetical protein [Gemmatimonadota bacterium]
IMRRGVEYGPIRDQESGILTHVVLPGGGRLGVYQPWHARPKPMRATQPGTKSGRPAKRGRSTRASKRPR